MLIGHYYDSITYTQRLGSVGMPKYIVWNVASLKISQMIVNWSLKKYALKLFYATKAQIPFYIMLYNPVFLY